MARTLRSSTRYEAPAEDLLRVLTDPDFEMTRQKMDEALKEVAFQEISRSDQQLIYELQATEYARGMTGLDKNKTVRTVTRKEWDLVARTSHWTYRSEDQEGRFRIWGEQRLEPSGEATILHADFHAEVKIPLLGKKIEKLILDGVEKARPEQEALLRRFLDKHRP